ncbi:unnamed protein product [Dicrocoelium dendriticum]|nr:unnamed protein product [Dicrocoelium dendriticum]
MVGWGMAWLVGGHLGGEELFYVGGTIGGGGAWGGSLGALRGDGVEGELDCLGGGRVWCSVGRAPGGRVVRGPAGLVGRSGGRTVAWGVR